MTSNEKHGAVYGDDGMLYLYVGSNAFYLHITVVMSLHITVVMSLHIFTLQGSMKIGCPFLPHSHGIINI